MPSESPDNFSADQPTELFGRVEREESLREATEAIDEQQALDSLYDETPRTEELETISANTHAVRPVVQGPTETVGTTIHRNDSRIRHGVAAAVVSIALLFFIGLGGGMFVRHLESERHNAEVMAENERKAQEAAEAQRIADEEAEAARELEKATAPRQLQFIVEATDFDTLSTRLPLSITGTDSQGTEVQTTGFVSPDGTGVALSPGQYSATIPASPVRPDGSLYKVPNATYSFKVPNDDQEIIRIDQAIVLIPMAMTEINEDLVNNAYNWAIKDTGNESVAESNVGAARKYIEEELARKREEERQAKLREERAPIAQNFAEDYFTNVGFPDDDDDSEVLVITNWREVAGQYLAKDSAAAGKLGDNPGALYSFATRVAATSYTGSSVVVEVTAVQSNEIKNGWTKNTVKKTITCTFNDDNLITDYTIG